MGWGTWRCDPRFSCPPARHYPASGDVGHDPGTRLALDVGRWFHSDEQRDYCLPADRLLSVKYSYRDLQANDKLKLMPRLKCESLPEAFLEEKPSLEDSVLQSSAVDITFSESESADG